MKKRSLTLAVLLALVAAIIGAVPALTTAQEAVTLVVWDNWTRDVEVAMIEQLNAEFEAAHPGVTIVKEAYVVDDLNALLPLALSEASGPDVAQVNQGYTAMGPMVGAGLLLPLDEYADQYGWWDRYAMSLHKRNSFAEDGSQIAVGNLYGVSNAAEIVGVYYHRDIFEEHGLSIPQTFAEFEEILATLKAAGVTPIVFGSLDGWPAIHEYGAIQHAYTDIDTLDAFMYRLEGGTFINDANLKAAEKLVEWVKAGYFSPGFEGMDYDNATFAAFLNKEGAMWITGSWMAGSIIEQLGEDAVGFFVFPPAEEGAPPLSIGGVNLAYGVRATTGHPDLAAEYVDWITGPRAAEVLLENGFLPASAVDVEALPEGTLNTDVVLGWMTISEANAVGHYLDWTVPNIAGYIQELMAERITPQEFLDKVEQEYLAG